MTKHNESNLQAASLTVYQQFFRVIQLRNGFDWGRDCQTSDIVIAGTDRILSGKSGVIAIPAKIIASLNIVAVVSSVLAPSLKNVDKLARP